MKRGKILGLPFHRRCLEWTAIIWKQKQSKSTISPERQARRTAIHARCSHMSRKALSAARSMTSRSVWEYHWQPSTAFKVRGATRGQGRTHGDQRTWWRGLRIAARRKTSTLRLLVQATVYQAVGESQHFASCG